MCGKRYQTTANTMVAKNEPNDVVQVAVAHALVGVPLASETRRPSPASILSHMESQAKAAVNISAKPIMVQTIVNASHTLEFRSKLFKVDSAFRIVSVVSPFASFTNKTQVWAP